MNQVKFYGEAELEHEAETIAQRRRIYNRIEGIIALTTLVAITALAYCWQAELQFLFSKASM